MIGYLQGTAISANCVLVGGVGYVVHTSHPLISGSETALHITTAVREDAITLYGFATEAAQQFFAALTKVQGVGPAMALALLRDLGPETILRATRTDDCATLTKATGVGRKTAERIIAMLVLPADLCAALDDDGPAAVSTAAPAGPHEELSQTLQGVGYSTDASNAAALAAHALHGPDASDQILLSAALSHLRGIAA